MAGWYGVDLDGTLAKYDGFHGIMHIGEPVPEMLARVKGWLAEGKTVKIFTARVSSKNSDRMLSRLAIEKWSLEHIGTVLECTAEKDYDMIELWDDRAVRVERNTGRVI